MCFLCKTGLAGIRILKLRPEAVKAAAGLPPKTQRDGAWLYDQIKAWIDRQTNEPLKAKYNRWLTELGDKVTLLSSLHSMIDKAKNEEKKAILRVWSKFLD